MTSVVGRLPPAVRGVVLFVLVGAGYVAGYKLAANWFSAEGQGASFFPPAGVTLAALVLVRRRQWPIVLGAAAVAELTLDLTNGIGAASAGYVLANVSEPLVGALLLTALVASVDLRRTRDLAAFVGFAVITAPIVGGVIAATTFVLDGGSGWARFAFEWWSGDGLGVLVVGGALLSLRFVRELPIRRVVEGVALGGLAIAATEAAFGQGLFEFIYLPIALLVVLAFRVGTTGVAVTGALVAFAAAGATAEAQDFWESVDISPANRILYLQLALAVIIAVSLALAAEIAQRERIAVELARAESERAAVFERAQLAESEQRARLQAESLGRSAASLARTATTVEVADAIVSMLSDWHTSQSTFQVVEGEQLRLVAAAGVDQATRERYGVIPVALEAPSSEAVRRAVPVVIQDGAEFDRRYPSLAAHRHRHPAETFAAFPIVADGTAKAVLTARTPEPRWLTDDRYDLLSALADQAAVALERASLLEREREARGRAELDEQLAVQLQHLTAALAAAKTAQDVARVVVSQLVAALDGTEGSLYVLDEDARLLRVVEPASHLGEVVRRHGDISLATSAPQTDAIRSRNPILVGDLDALCAAYPGRTGHPATGCAWAYVPLLAGTRPVGMLSVAYASPQPFSRRQQDALVSIGDAVAQALHRAELHEAEHVARTRAELLERIASHLVDATTVSEVARSTVDSLGLAGMGTAVVGLLEADAVRVVAASGVPGSTVEHMDAAVDDLTVLTDVVRTGKTIVVSTGEEYDERYPAGTEVRRRTGIQSAVGAPLRGGDGRVIGALVLGALEPRWVDGEKRQLIGSIAKQCGLALERALLFEAERDVSRALQLGLLGGGLPSTRAATIAGAYRPGTATLEVGGDWYDSFILPDGRLALLVGDVVGHGLEAAVAMGQLRGAVRALAPMGPPHRVLEGLDTFVEQLPTAEMATLAYAELDPEDGRLAYACAGHPPPLLVPAEGEPRLLWEGRSTPLGSFHRAGPRGDAIDRLEPGDTIVLYTDGLVERRTDGISAGLEVLLTCARHSSGREPSHLVDRILDACLEDRALDDDVCVLAVRRVASELRFVHSFPAAPAEVARMRRALTEWLEQVDLDPEGRRDAILAASEAAANSVEHAYDFDGKGVTRVEAWVSDGSLHLSIRDEGRWRTPRAETDRGHGRTIMEALMPIVAIDHGESGTVVRMRVPTRREVSV